MKKKTLILISVTCALCFAAAVWSQAEEGIPGKYYVGKVVGLDAVDNTMTITEYNTNSPKEFIFRRYGLPEGFLLGDEVVIVADKDNGVIEIRPLSSRAGHFQGRPVSGYGRGRIRRSPGPGFFEGTDPFSEIARMQDQISRMFRDSVQEEDINQGLFNSNLSFDKDFKMEDAGSEYIIKLDLSGMDKDSVKIEIDKDSITFKGQTDVEREEADQNGSFQYRSFGTFLKSIPLPPDADTKNMDTKLDGDIMIIKLPKKTS